METIIKNALVDGKLVDIRVKDGVIDSIGKFDQDGYDACGKVAIPGFVDCHMHLDKCLLNELEPYQDGTGPEKGALTRKQKETFTVENITKRAERMIKRAIASGAVAVRTNVDVDAIVGLKGIEALLALREKYKNVLTIQIAAFTQEGVYADGKSDSLMREAVTMGVDLVAGHTIAAGEGEKAIDFILDLAAKNNMEAEFHLDESGNREHYLLPYLAERMKALGLTGRVNAVHMCTLAALEADELKRALELCSQVKLKATVAPTAISTRSVAPAKDLLQSGILVGLGSDNTRDFFNPLGSGDVKQVALLLSYLQRFFTSEQVMQIYDMITKRGAQLLGLKDYGISPGNPADITILDAVSPTEVIAYGAQPVYNMRKGLLTQI